MDIFVQPNDSGQVWTNMSNILAHSYCDHQSLPGHICPNPVRIGLKGITKKLNDKTEPLNGQDTYLGEIHHFQIKKFISRLLDRFPFTIRQGSKKEDHGGWSKVRIILYFLFEPIH